MNNIPNVRPVDPTAGNAAYNYFLLLAAWLNARLGTDIGIITGAPPYLEENCGLNAGRLSLMGAIALLGREISTLPANSLTVLLGCKTLLYSNAATFVLGEPTIVLAHCFGLLAHGWLPKEMMLLEWARQQNLSKRLAQV